MRDKTKGLNTDTRDCAPSRFWGVCCALRYELKYPEDKRAAGIKTKLASLQSTRKSRGIVTSLEILLVWEETDFC